MAQTNQQIIVNEAEVDWDSKLDNMVDEILGEEPDEVLQTKQEVTDEDVEVEEVEASPVEDNEEESEPEYVEIKHNGKPIKMTLDEVLEHASKGFDYTAKTQELAEQRRAIEQQAQLLQQQYQYQQATMEQTAKVYAMDSQLQNYQNVNWDAWMDQDPVEASKGWQKFQMLKSQRDEVANQIQQTQTKAQLESQQRLYKQMQDGSAQLAREIKGWSPELAKSMKVNALDYGFSESELDQVYDPRMVKVLHDAYQWRQLQGKKPEVQKRVNQAPKSGKPTGKPLSSESDNRAKLMKQLKSAKGINTRRAIAESLLDKFI